MIRTDTHPEFDQFLDSVCRHVRAKQLHGDIKDELVAHLDELVEENLDSGKSEKEAVNLAVARMGEPEQIGRELDHTHRPRTDWGMLLLIAILSGLGLLAMYNVQMTSTGPFSYSHLFENKMTHHTLPLLHLGMAIIIQLSCQLAEKAADHIY
jgi:hypothetical protein